MSARRVTSSRPGGIRRDVSRPPGARPRIRRPGRSARGGRPRHRRAALHGRAAARGGTSPRHGRSAGRLVAALALVNASPIPALLTQADVGFVKGDSRPRCCGRGTAPSSRARPDAAAASSLLTAQAISERFADRRAPVGARGGHEGPGGHTGFLLLPGVVESGPILCMVLTGSLVA